MRFLLFTVFGGADRYSMTSFSTMPQKSRVYFFSDDPNEFLIMRIRSESLWGHGIN